MRFIEKFKIEVLVLGAPGYPKRLLNCYDAPLLLYFRGKADLNAEKIVSIIGTQNDPDYGKDIKEEYIKESMAPYKVLIVSGLAYGVDSIAHKLALKQDLPNRGYSGSWGATGSCG